MKIVPFAPFVDFVSLPLCPVQAFVINKKGLSKKDSPREEGEDAIVLFVAAQFAHQHDYEDNWQSNQGEHEENSEAHHGICLLSCFI